MFRISSSYVRRAAQASVVVLALGSATVAHAAVSVGQLAPDFIKTDLTGATQTLSAYRGRIVVLFLLGYG